MTTHADIRARVARSVRTEHISLWAEELAALLADNDRLRAALDDFIAALTTSDKPRQLGQQGREIQAAIKQARAALDGSGG